MAADEKKETPSAQASEEHLREQIASRVKAPPREEAKRPETRRATMDSSQFQIPTPAPGAGPAAEDARAAEPSGPRKSVTEIINSALQTNIVLTGPGTKDMSTFCRQLSTLLDVGIPLLRALKILAERTSHPTLRRIAAQVTARVEEGHTLSSALREHPKTFSRLFVSVIEVGELGGILESSVRRLADLLEMKMTIKRKVRAAMMYPCVAMTVCLAVIVFVMTWAVPKFAAMYEQLHAELPKLTQRMIAISNFFVRYPALYVPLTLAVIAGLWLFGKTRTGRVVYDWITLRIKVIGPIATKINVARFTRSVGSLVAAGIPLLEALRVTARTSENTLIARKLQEVHDVLEAGGRMEEPLRRDTIVPPMVVDMMVIGYESGALDDMLLRIADSYDAEVDEVLKGLASIIEPLLILVLGCVVAFVGAAVLLPYFSMVHNI